MQMEAILERLVALQNEMNSLILEVRKNVQEVSVEKRKVGRPKKIVLVAPKEPYKMTDEHKAKLKAGREARIAKGELVEPTVELSPEHASEHASELSSEPVEAPNEKPACHREPPLSCAENGNEFNLLTVSSPSPSVSSNKPKIKLVRKEPRRMCRICVTDLQQGDDHRPCIETAFNEGRFKSVAEWEDDCIEFAKRFAVTTS